MIAICVQYHSSDRELADRLLRFMADIEPVRREDVKLRLVARKDCEHIDMTTIQYVGKKFDVTWAKSDSAESGWPAGPNAMACGIVSGASRWLHDVGWTVVDTLFLLEPDVVPLRPTWITEIAAEWAKAKAAGAIIMGSWRASGGAYGHINGNCLIASDAWGMSCFRNPPRSLAWDCHVAPYLRHRWHITGLIRNDFQGREATELQLKTPEVGEHSPALVHGFKDDSAEIIARRWIKL